MIKMTGHIGHMKVNSAELKTHLGRYLRAVEQDRATLEVRLRDRTVAFLIPACDAGQSLENTSGGLPAYELKRAGMRMDSTVPFRGKTRLAQPILAGDQREDVVTVERMRQERDW